MMSAHSSSGRHRVLGLAICASAISVSGGAHAQADDQTVGTRLPTDAYKSSEGSDADAARESRHLMVCVVKRRRSSAQAFLDATTRDAVAAAAANLSYNDCTTRSEGGIGVMRRVSMSDDVYRGLVAEALLEDEKRDIAALAPLPQKNLYESEFSAVTGRNKVVDDMAKCLAEVDPADISGLIDTTPNTGAERDAFGLLAPHFGPCLQTNVKLSATKQSMRAAMAEALYHRLHPVTLPAQQGSGQ